MDCINSKPSDEKDADKDCRCDDLVRALDECLKSHAEYYNAIDPNEEEVKKEDENATEELMLAWKALISELESRNKGEGGGDIDNDSANYGSVRHLEFTKDLQPKVEVRPRDNSGIVQFHPIWARSEGYILTSPLQQNT